MHTNSIFLGNIRVEDTLRILEAPAVVIMHVCAAETLSHMHPGSRKSWILHECKPRACPSAREDLCSRVTWDFADLEQPGAAASGEEQSANTERACAHPHGADEEAVWNVRKRFLFWVKTNPTILGRKHKSDSGGAQKSPGCATINSTRCQRQAQSAFQPLSLFAVICTWP